MTKLNWNNLNKKERAEYMIYQMAGNGKRTPTIPDDCYECPVCSTPSLSSRLCPSCSSRFDELYFQLTGGQ